MEIKTCETCFFSSIWPELLDQWDGRWFVVSIDRHKDEIRAAGSFWLSHDLLVSTGSDRRAAPGSSR